MKTYTEIEPVPSYKSPRWWPVLPAWALAVALSFTWQPWGFFAYIPFVIIQVRLVVLVLIRSRRFNREIDAWDGRMNAYYDNLTSQRDKAQWS